MNDLRYALRSLTRQPGFATITVVTLALGVGVTTAAFSVANWLLFRPVPGILDADRLAIVWFGERKASGFVSRYSVTTSQLRQLKDAVPSLSGLAGFTREEVSVATGGQGRRAEVEIVGPGYFSALGTRPSLGRLLALDDDAPPGGSPVAVIGYDLWIDLFARDPGVLGAPLRVNTHVFTVVGVAPPGFQGAERQRSPRLWLPGRASLAIQASLGDRVPLEPAYSEFVARLSEGATFRRAESELEAASQAITGYGPIVYRGIGVWPPIRASAEDSARLLLAVTGLVLLIACANAANLMLFRGVERRAQTAMRKVLGAHLRQLIRQQAGESLLVGALAGSLGLVIGIWLVDAFEGLRLWQSAAPVSDIPLDWRVAGFALGAALAAALLASVVPVLVASRIEPVDAVRGTTPSETTSGVARQAFAGLQIALSLALLVGALLLVGTLRGLSRVELGFDPTGVSAVSITPRDQGYSAVELQQYYQEFLRGVREIPGVESAALAFTYPFANRAFRLSRLVPASAGPDAAPILAVSNGVSPGYFETLRIPLLRGRVFADDEFLAEARGVRRPVIVSQSLARRLFGDRDPIGELLGGDGIAEVVGVVADTRFASLDRNDVAFASEGTMLYGPIRLFGMESLLVRSRRPHTETMAAVRGIAERLDSAIPLHGETTLESAINGTLSDRVLFARLLSLLSVLAVAVASVGLYGLIAYGVARRTREFGVRIAVGASPADIVESIVRDGLVVSTAGAGAGVLAAYVVASLLQSRLFGVTPAEPGVYALATLLVMVVAIGASLAPARRATNVDPIAALRAE